jgi:hypothetical protein
MSGYGAPVLRSADIRIAIDSSNTCTVTMTLTVDGGGALDHRIAAVDDTRIDLSGVRGARQLQELRTVDRTHSLILDAPPSAYEVAYSVQRPVGQDRCPLWVPAAPADGVSRAVRISVELPPGMSSRSTMPAFTWTGSTGTTTLGHIPAFVRVAFAAAGDSTPWDAATAMDALAMLAFVGASGIWAWRRSRRR